MNAGEAAFKQGEMSRCNNVGRAHFLITSCLFVRQGVADKRPNDNAK